MTKIPWKLSHVVGIKFESTFGLLLSTNINDLEHYTLCKPDVKVYPAQRGI